MVKEIGVVILDTPTTKYQSFPSPQNQSTVLLKSSIAPCQIGFKDIGNTSGEKRWDFVDFVKIIVVDEMTARCYDVYSLDERMRDPSQETITTFKETTTKARDWKGWRTDTTWNACGSWMGYQSIIRSCKKQTLTIESIPTFEIIIIFTSYYYWYSSSPSKNTTKRLRYDETTLLVVPAIWTTGLILEPTSFSDFSTGVQFLACCRVSAWMEPPFPPLWPWLRSVLAFVTITMVTGWRW